MLYPPAFPHDPIQEISAGVFMVRGSLRINPLLRISRNMVILCRDGVLSLINSVRLNEAGIAELEQLGKVQRIIRLGSLHGLDDAWYVKRFGAEFWCQPGSQKYPLPAIDVVLNENQPLPFPNAKLFCFNSVEPESALLLEQGNGLLLTCDAIQHYGDYRHMSLLARIILPFIGFPKTTIVGPLWLKAMTPVSGSLLDDFERLLALDFDSLLSAHGSFLRTGARGAAQTAISRAFPA